MAGLSVTRYQQAVNELESLGIMPERPPSLEPMRRALEASGLLPRVDSERVVVVAGTNGKGSVCAMVAALLESAGLRVGLYTSPHLMETTERIRISGQDLSPEDFARVYHKVRPIIMAERLTHFEALTLMAAWVFFSSEGHAPVDWAVLEVGLGGLWDATNAIPHRWCAITSLGLDHQNLLGSTLSSIAANKLGIVGRGARVIHASLPEEVRALATEIAASTGSSWREAAAVAFDVSPGPEGPCFRAITPWGPAELSLAGPRAARNAAVALTLVESMGIDPSAHLASLAKVRWPGRMERLHVPGAPCPVYLSGDHNPQGIESLLELLPYYPRAHLHVLVGVGRDKDLDGMLGPLSRLADTSIHLTVTPFRGRRIEEYGPWIRMACTSGPDPTLAFKRILGVARPGQAILVTGSLYLVGKVRADFSIPKIS